MATENVTTVRRAVATDVAALSAIGSEAFSAAYAKFNSPTDMLTHLRENYSPAAIRRAMKIPGQFYLLALVDDEPAGICKLSDRATPKGIPHPASLEIRQLYIHPAHQRRGIGKALVDATLIEAGASGLAGVWLGVWEKADWAIAFYSKYGFEQFGSHTFQLASSRQTDLLMWVSVPST